jgi:hypothetical protein
MRYLLQLPYLNEQGNPRVIEIDESAAEQLLRAKSHRAFHMTDDCSGLTPIVRAAVDVQFQLGSQRY